MTATEYMVELWRLDRQKDFDGMIEWKRLHYLEVVLQLDIEPWYQQEQLMRRAAMFADEAKVQRMIDELSKPLYDLLKADGERKGRKVDPSQPASGRKWLPWR